MEEEEGESYLADLNKAPDFIDEAPIEAPEVRHPVQFFYTIIGYLFRGPFAVLSDNAGGHQDYVVGTRSAVACIIPNKHISSMNNVFNVYSRSLPCINFVLRESTNVHRDENGVQNEAQMAMVDHRHALDRLTIFSSFFCASVF